MEQTISKEELNELLKQYPAVIVNERKVFRVVTQSGNVLLKDNDNNKIPLIGIVGVIELTETGVKFFVSSISNGRERIEMSFLNYTNMK
jgi:hypothetical protein